MPNDFDLSQKQSDAWDYLHTPGIDEVFFGGGARSGKSWLMCINEIDGSTKYPGTVGLLGRKEHVDLRDSTMFDFFRIVARMGYRDEEHYKFNAKDQIVQWANGSITMFRHLKYEPQDPDYTRIGSTAFTRIGVDEANEIEERLLEMLIMRCGFKPPPHGGKVLVTGNPGPYWTRTRYVFDDKTQRVELPKERRAVFATVEDNPDPEVRDEYRRRLQNLRDEYDRQRLLYGDWLATPRTGKEFFHAFSTQRHVKHVAYDPNLALHITLDFNTAPYMTLLAAQIRRPDLTSMRWRLSYLKEYCLEHPLNRTRHVCTALKTDLVDGCFAGHNTGMFVYGDYSGKNDSTMATETERHNYDVVFSVLSKWANNHSDRVLPNPSHVRAGDFMNDIYSDRLPIEISIDPLMTNTIRDLSHLKQGADGGILKEMETDRKTGIRYEKMGHCAQAHYYLPCSAFRDIFEEHGRRAA